MHQGPYSRSTTFFQRPRGATVARLTADQKVAWSNHFGVRWSLIGMKCLIWKTPFSLQDRFGFLYTGFFLSGDTKSEENGNVNAKVKTNLLRAELNQRPKDSQHIIYSPPLYQLSYRRIGRHNNTQRNLESLTSWVFWWKSGCVLW